MLSGSPDIDSVVLVSDTNDGQTMTPTRYTDLLYDASLRSPKPFYFMNTRSNLMRMELVDKFRNTGVGMLTGLRQGFGAIGRMGRWAQRSEPPPSVAFTSSTADAALQQALSSPRRTINEVDAKSIVRALGIAAVEDRLVSTAQDAVRSAAAIGYPVVLKAVSDEIPHRSEYGLVAVGLKNADEVLQAYADHDTRIAKLGLEPATVQRVVQPLAPKRR